MVWLTRCAWTASDTDTAGNRYLRAVLNPVVRIDSDTPATPDGPSGTGASTVSDAGRSGELGHPDAGRSDGPTPSRRGFLRGVGATAALAGAASTPAAAQATTHTVDMTDTLLFEPDAITIAPGDTVVWENVGSIGHSITAYEDDIPDGAPYWASGDLASESEARSSYPDQGDVAGGETYEHTFETLGTHEYFCIPHEAAGMLGAVEVVEGGAAAAAESSGPDVPQVPDSARSLAIATVTAMASVLALAWFFIKYGGDYDEAENVGQGKSRPR